METKYIITLWITGFFVAFFVYIKVACHYDPTMINERIFKKIRREKVAGEIIDNGVEGYTTYVFKFENKTEFSCWRVGKTSTVKWKFVDLETNYQIVGRMHDTWLERFEEYVMDSSGTTEVQRRADTKYRNKMLNKKSF